MLKEAAELLDVTPATLRQQIANGALVGAEKRGRDWHVPAWSVELYRRNHGRGKTAPVQGITYSIRLSTFIEDGMVTISAVADVTGEGSGPYGAGSTVEEAVANLAVVIREQAESRSDIDVPEGVKVER